MLHDSEIPLIVVQEPQIEGVTDEDIKDESQPVTYEGVEDSDIVDRTNAVAEGSEA